MYQKANPNINMKINQLVENLNQKLIQNLNTKQNLNRIVITFLKRDISVPESKNESVIKTIN